MYIIFCFAMFSVHGAELSALVAFRAPVQIGRQSMLGVT